MPVPSLPNDAAGARRTVRPAWWRLPGALLLCLLSALPLLVARQLPAADACDEALLERVQSAYQALDGFQGRFEQEDRRDDGGVLTAQGSIAYRKPGQMRWEYDPPNEQLLVTDGETVWLYDPLLENVTIESLADVAPGTPLTFLLGAGKLTRDFRCRALTRPPPDDGLTYLELVPREPIPTLESIQLGVRPSTAALVVLVMIDPQGNARVVRMKDITYGVAGLPETFTFAVSDEMEVIRP